MPSNHRVLVADPDVDTRVRYATACAAERWDVMEAADGMDALVKALIRAPSLVLTQLRLPVIDGISLCTLLRRDRATTDVPIAVLPSDATPSETTRALSAGADLVLTNAMHPDAVIQELQRLMAGASGRPCPMCGAVMVLDRRPPDMMIAGGPIWMCMNPSCRYTAVAPPDVQ